MRIPVFVITGFLDAGKTTLLNTVLNRPELGEAKLVLIQFEAGEASFCSERQNCEVLSFFKRDLERGPEEIARRIADCLRECKPDMMWVEWNGIVPFGELQTLFFQMPLSGLCRMEKVVHVTNADTLDMLLGRTGDAMPEQIANSDLVVVRNSGSGVEQRKIKRTLRGLNPGVKVYGDARQDPIFNELFDGRAHPVGLIFLGIVWLVAVYFMAATPLSELTKTPVNTFINVFLGIMLQAVPFLLIGVMLSSAIQILLPGGFVERIFPKNLGLGILAAIFLGFCLPVCDCASVPIFKSLVKKGVPLPAAVTFLTVTPVINPVCMLSTYYAYSGSLRVVAVRAGLGILSSVLIGLFFAWFPAHDNILAGGSVSTLCSCGCYGGVASVTGRRDRLVLFLRHSQTEFFYVGKYLMLGALLSACFQMIGVRTLSAPSDGGFALSLLIMMAAAFLLSLCSSSDAVVARSFGSGFSNGAVMGFLVFGPMMDVKNLLMLSGGFSGKFVRKLLLLTVTVCYGMVFLFARPLLGV